ncbi:MAG: membrane integrity-associated transporter subunit PqiC [Parahaliea sp.]
MNTVFRISLLALLLGLGACGSTPRSDYFRLSGSTPDNTGNEPSIGIGPVEIPKYLQRNGMVYNQGEHQLQIASYQRWAEPLAEGITRVLGLNLSAALNTQNTRPFPWPPSDRPRYAVQVWLLSLDTSANSSQLAAEWRLYSPAQQREVTRRISRYQGPGSAFDGAQLAASYSQLLNQLSDDIAQAINEDMAQQSIFEQ